MRRLRSADELIVPALAGSLGHLLLSDADTVLVRLAERYAAAIDDADDRVEALATFGPKLRLVLESLGATPRQRELREWRSWKEEQGGDRGPEQPSGALARIREARARSSG